MSELGSALSLAAIAAIATLAALASRPTTPLTRATTTLGIACSPTLSAQQGSGFLLRLRGMCCALQNVRS